MHEYPDSELVNFVAENSEEARDMLLKNTPTSLISFIINIAKVLIP